MRDVSDVREEFVRALESSTPFDSLYHTVKSSIVGGEAQESLYEEMLSWLTALQREGREQDEEVVADVMDCLAGFCSPTMRM